MAHLDLPFSHVQVHEIRAHYGFPFSITPTDELLQYPVSVWKQGNYITAFIRRGLREEARRAMQYSFPLLRPGHISHLPNELLFEIFEKLHPLDLYSVCQTAKDLSRVLLNGQAVNHVWKQTYESYPDIPSCPKDLSFPKWTSLLFGPDTCDICGSQHAMTDISFRTHFCDHCVNLNYFTRSDLKCLLQSDLRFPRNVWTLLRSSTRSSGITYTRHESKRYLKADVEEANRRTYKSAVNPEAGGSEADSMTREELEYALAHRNHTGECNKWCRKQYTLCERDHEVAARSLAKRFVSHKLAKRFDSQDILSSSVTSALYELFLYSGVRKLRGPVFRQSIPSIEKILSDARARRLEGERTAREHERCKRIHDEFDGYMATMPARNWTYLPLCGRVFNHPMVQRFVFSETTTPDVNGGDLEKKPQVRFEEVVCELKRFIVTCFADHQRDLYAALEAFDRRVALTRGSTDHGRVPATVDRMDLATTIFVCPVCSYKSERLGAGESMCIGRRELGLHANCWDPESLPASYEEGWNARLEISPEGTKAAKCVVGLLGLDAATAVAAQLDERDARFLCGTCWVDEESGGSGREVLSWRDCISHQMKMRDEQSHQEPSFMLLPEEAASCVRFHEQPFPPPTALVWSCMRCTDHLASRVTRQTATTHFKQIHGPYPFYEPIVDVDYFYFPQSYSIPPRRKYRLPFDGPYRCMRCPEHLNRRLRSSAAVLAHLKEKHGIRTPTAGDWMSVQVEGKEAEMVVSPSETECYDCHSKFYQMYTNNCL